MYHYVTKREISLWVQTTQKSTGKLGCVIMVCVFSFPFLLADGTYAICEFIGARNERFPGRMALWQNYLFRREDIVSYAVVDEITERVNMKLSKVNKIKR